MFDVRRGKDNYVICLLNSMDNHCDGKDRQKLRNRSSVGKITKNLNNVSIGKEWSVNGNYTLDKTILTNTSRAGSRGGSGKPWRGIPSQEKRQMRRILFIGTIFRLIFSSIEVGLILHQVFFNSYLIKFCLMIRCKKKSNQSSMILNRKKMLFE